MIAPYVVTPVEGITSRAARSGASVSYAQGDIPAQGARQRLALLYLENLRADFQRLLRLASVITVLSPEIAASHEFERMRLSIRFSWRYRIVLFGLYAGHLLMPQLSNLSQIVGDLSFRMESAMQELGERASVAAELASTLNRSGLDPA